MTEPIIDGVARTQLTMLFKNNLKLDTKTPYTFEQLREIFDLTVKDEIIEFMTAGDNPEHTQVRRGDLCGVIISSVAPDSRIIRARPALPSGMMRPS